MIDQSLYEKVAQEPFSLNINRYAHTGYAFSEHWHEHTELHLILEGSCLLDCNGTKIPLTAGDCAVINGGELHRGATGDCVFLCILLSPVFFGNTHTVLERVIRDPHVSEQIPQLAALSECTDLASVLEMRGRVQILMSHLIRNYKVRVVDGSLYSKQLAKLDKVNRAVTYVNQNYEKKITTATLAKITYLNESYFCHLFKSVMGQSAVEYLTSVRLEKAENLLRTTAMSIAEIAFVCGFSDANYFSRTYKKHKGESPGATRTDKKDLHN